MHRGQECDSHGVGRGTVALLRRKARTVADLVCKRAVTCLRGAARLSRYFPLAARCQIRVLRASLFITRCSIIHLMHDRLGQLPTRNSLPRSLSLSLCFPFFSLSVSSSFHLLKELSNSALVGRRKGSDKNRAHSRRSELCWSRG